MSEVPPISNSSTNSLHTGDKIITTSGNIQFEPDAVYHKISNDKLGEIQSFVKNGMLALIDHASPTISEEA